MKKWYCPHCKVFKRFKRTHAGYGGYPDWHTCRCCGTELYNVQEVLEIMVRNRIEDMEVEHGSKYKR